MTERLSRNQNHPLSLNTHRQCGLVFVLCFVTVRLWRVQIHHLGVRMHSVSYSRMVSIGICSVIVQKSSVLFRRQLSRGKEENQRFLFLLNS